IGTFLFSLPCFAGTDPDKELEEAQATILNLQKENSEIKQKIEELGRKLLFWQNDSKSWETIATIRKSGEGGIDELNKELDLAIERAGVLSKENERKSAQLKRTKTLNWVLVAGAVLAVATK
ncbi:unnamed protein product, partial [marine sediment metagenome]